MELTNPAHIRQVLSRHGFHFSKKLGQNFLIDPSVCPRMAQACGAGPDLGVLEIGPGAGVLTAALADCGGPVTAIELDRRLLPVLAETLAGRSNVHIVQGDALQMDLRGLLAKAFPGMPAALCANLPYYLTSPLLLHLLEQRLPLQSITVMVQKEAAQRLCAAPGTRACGAVSAAVWYYAEPAQLFAVGRESFLPSPQVDSAVIQLRLRDRPPVQVRSEAALFATVRAAFSQRRKTAANALSASLHLPKAQVQQALAQVGAAPTARAEELPLPQLAALSDLLTPAAPDHIQEEVK